MSNNVLVYDNIYNESCLDTLKRMKDNSVDLVVTSPPYNMNLRIRNGKYCSRQIVKEFSTKYSGFSDNIPIDEFYEFHLSVLKELIRVSKLVFYNIQIVTGSKRAFFKIIGELSDYLKEIIVWDKCVAQPAMQVGVLNSRHEFILVFERDYAISRMFKDAKFARGSLDNLWEIKRERSKSHMNKAVFPSKLVETILINFSDVDSIIYDPFAGTGTTCVVSKKLGRRFIGSEISNEMVSIAVDRLNSILGDCK